MAVDEYGREPGVDYSSQSWTIAGITLTDKTDVDALEAQIEADAAAAAALVAQGIDPRLAGV